LATRRRPRGSALLLLLAALPACGGGSGIGALLPPTEVLSFHVENAWLCADTVNCQDVYDLVLAENTNLTVSVTQVTGPSVVRLAVYEPGIPLGGLNLLTGTSNDRRCALANAADAVEALAVPAGTYRIAIGRDWGFSSGASGTYTLDVTTDKALTPAGQTVNDQATQAMATQCP
jgi:hypothetical protein